jgi:hypothetical protein
MLRLVDGTRREVHMQEDYAADLLGRRLTLVVALALGAGMLGLRSASSPLLPVLLVASAILVAVAQQTLP